MDFIIIMFGYILIYSAVDYGRTPDCKYNMFTSDGLVIFTLVTLGGIILFNAR